jgi:sirohydrochlorin ferrochelatase
MATAPGVSGGAARPTVNRKTRAIATVGRDSPHVRISPPKTASDDKPVKLLGKTLTPGENLMYSLRRYRTWWVILLASMVFDVLTTLNFVDETGIRAEANPFVAWLMRHLGLYAGLTAAKLAQLLSVAVMVCLSRRPGNLFLLLVILLNCWAVVMSSLPHYRS